MYAHIKYAYVPLCPECLTKTRGCTEYTQERTEYKNTTYGIIYARLYNVIYKISLNMFHYETSYGNCTIYIQHSYIA